ncbi:hypothetical protein, partial [Bifidobacterium bifidum]|uniref:hypothetical protein n=1 Tax=Bifidobacterium bifidum TaxID=1681 RepID=UPI001EDAE9DD
RQQHQKHQVLQPPLESAHGGTCHIPRESNISAAVWKRGPFSAEYSWISRKAENVSVGTALC